MIEPIKYNKATISKFSLIFLFCLNNIINPIPAPVNNPHIAVPKVITPLR